MRIRWEHIRRLAAYLASFAIACALVAPVGNFFIAWADQRGWYKNPRGTVHAVIESLSWGFGYLTAVTSNPWFHWLGGSVLGFAIGASLDTWVRRRERGGNGQPEMPPPQMSNYRGTITGVAAFDVDGQPGLLDVIAVARVQNLTGDTSIGIDGFTLKIQLANGIEKEAEAQPIFDPHTFKGPSGETEITPDNTLWKRDGAPQIARFHSGRIWFQFSGIYDFTEFNNLDTCLTFTIKDGSGSVSSSTIRLGDISGPRISSRPIIGLPAASPPSPVPPASQEGTQHSQSPD